MSDLSNIPKQSYFSAQLQSPIDSSQTTGITLTAVPDFTPAGETIYFNILDANNVETISATGWTGTTLTGVTRAVATYSGESATGYAHAAGITVVLSDDWKYFEAVQTAVNSKADSAGDTFTGPVDFSGASTTLRIPNLTEAQRDALGSPANGMLVYNTTSGEFQYYDGGAWASVGTASVPNASTTVAGIIELATAAERAAGTATGGTGATLVPTNDALVKTSSGAGDENKIAILDSAGKFATGFIDATSTPTADKIVQADPDGKIGEGWLQMTDSQATDLTDGGSTTLHYHPSILYKSVSSVSVPSSSSNEVTMFSFTVPGNTLSTNNIIKFKAFMSMSGTSSNLTFTLKLKYGSTDVVTATKLTGGIGGTSFLEGFILANNSTSSQYGALTMNYTNDTTGALTIGNTGTATEDSTGDLVLQMTGKWSSTSATQTYELKNVVVEVIKQ